ncbi:transporter substrate-binding domain-containing protein [Desulfococcaceae bacterium HSG8]|nr:transporter substrate-binding domain-containing protein [Desulfococcaceae bacterium HSG8]
MKKLIIIFTFLAFCSANAEEITVVTEEWPPFNYTENGKVIGVVTEVVEAVLDKAGIKAKIRAVPWARAYKMASEDENTLIYTIFRMPERESLFHWIKLDGLSTRMYLYSPGSRSDIVIKSLEDAKKYRIGVTRKTSTHVFLHSKGFQEDINLFPVNSEVQNAMKADPSVNRIDLTTGDKLSLAMWLKKSDLPPDYWKEEIFLFKEDFYMAFAKKTSDEVVERVRDAFQQVKAEGKLDAFIEKYMRTYQQRTPAPKK